MSDFARELTAWTLAVLLTAAATGVPLVAVWRWRRGPVPAVFLVLAGLSLWPWALHRAEDAYRASLVRRVEAAVRREFGVPPGVWPGAVLSDEEDDRFRDAIRDGWFADPVFAFNMRTGLSGWLQDEDTATLSWLAAAACGLVAAGSRPRWGPAGAPRTGEIER